MKEKIIILRTFKWREADLMVHGLNPKGGRMHFIARGGAKSRKRFGGGILEPTHYILAHYRPGHSRDDEAPLHTIEEAELIKGFNGLRDRYERLELALFMLSLTARVAHPGVEDAPELFDLLGNGLYAAETSFHFDLLRLQFEAKLLYLQGVLPASPEYAPLLQPPLKEHAQIQLSKEDFNRIQHEVKVGIERYLGGLAGPNGLEL
jgi:DNA repair protein RecO (recombination protein O)